MADHRTVRFGQVSEARRSRAYDQSVEDQPIAYIDRIYDDPEFPAPQPWPRRRRWFSDEPEWQAACDRGTAETFEESGFDSVDDALAWARERAQIVLVRLGSSEETFYSAGAIRANEYVDESGDDYLEWPPDYWPDYKGPDAETRKFEGTGEPL
jgi:hypothetical protein